MKGKNLFFSRKRIKNNTNLIINNMGKKVKFKVFEPLRNEEACHSVTGLHGYHQCVTLDSSLSSLADRL